jgi:Ser/Thr protein kinase RdoA (MazF antagonist)
MNLGLMKRFFDTVDGEWHSPLLNRIVAPWFEGAVNVQIVRASANFVAFVEAPQGQFFLRFNHASERQPEGIAAELDYIQRVAQGGVRVSRPLPSRAGKLVESVDTELGVFHAVLLELVPGRHLEFEALDLPAFERWGRVVGEVHRAGAGPHITGRPAWTDWIALARHTLPPAETLAWRELEAVEAALRALSVSDETFGMIHFDLELDNLLWDDEQAGVIDFDDCSYNWLAADIAFALRDLFENRPANVNFDDERLQAFLRGYRSAHPLSPEALRTLPLFLRLSNLILFARVTYSLAEGPLPGEPAWLTTLRDHLGHMLAGYRQDFEAHPLESVYL